MKEKCDSDVVNAMMLLRGEHASDPGVMPSKSHHHRIHETASLSCLKTQRRTKDEAPSFGAKQDDIWSLNSWP